MQEAPWYYAVGQQAHGPVDAVALQRLQQQGTVDAATLLWRDGMQQWQPLQTLQTEGVIAPAERVERVKAIAATTVAGQMANPYQAPGSEPDADIRPLGDALEGRLGRFGAVVGGNFPIYRHRWRLDQGTPSAAGRWHWIGFLMGSTWFAFRRMYREVAISLGMLVLGMVLDVLLKAGGAVFLVAWLAVAVMGGFGYQLYLRHCQRELQRAEALHAGDEAAVRRALAYRGDTSVAVTAATLCVMWLLFSFATTLPGFA